MFVVDSLYGGFELSTFLEPIFRTPELQRLRDIRLLNIYATSQAAVGDVRRLTHSLGVSYLGERLKPKLLREFSESEVREWQIALAIHDVGTPPFGHLFERVLNNRWDWNHEHKLLDIIFGLYRPENIHHQLYYGAQLQLSAVLSRLDVDPRSVAELVMGKGPLGTLISSNIDIDNIDNVYRMHAALGLGYYPEAATSIVDSIVPWEHGFAFTENSESLIEEWNSARQRCYQVLLFDETALAAEAMLFDAFETALDAPDPYLGVEYWHLTDEQVLRFLHQDKRTRNIVMRYSNGDYFCPLGLWWYEHNEKSAEYLRDTNTRRQLEADISKSLGSMPIVIYAIEDLGRLSKEVNVFISSQSNSFEGVTLGKMSKSLLVGVFTPNRNILKRERNARAISAILSTIGLTSDLRRSTPNLREQYGISCQTAFPI